MPALFYTTNECLVWKTEKPTPNQCQTSPLFTISVAKWRVELHHDNYVGSSDVYYTLFIKKCDDPSRNILKNALKKWTRNKGENFSKFALKTWIKDEDENVFETYHFVQQAEHNTSTQLWRISEKSLLQMIQKSERDGAITIVCAFHDLQGGSLAAGIDVGELKPSSTGSSYEKENPNSTILDTTFNQKCFSQDICNLLNYSLMADVKLKCGDITFSVHKVILAARSEVFSAMVQGRTSEIVDGTIHIENIDFSVMEIFLKYLYSGNIPDNLSDDMLIELYIAGHRYSVYPLLKNCTKFSGTGIPRRVFQDSLTHDDICKDHELIEAFTDFIITNGKPREDDAEIFIYHNPSHIIISDE